MRASAWLSAMTALLSPAFGTGERSFDKTFFVSEIFQKYGTRDYMTYEGFEHLLANLGLGQLNFEVNHDVSIHKINGTFKEFHDELKLHRHNHEDAHSISRRNLRQFEGTTGKSNREKKCLTPEDLLAIYGFETSHGVVLSRKGFAEICPAIVYELDQKSCRSETEKTEIPVRDSEYYLVWLYASLSIVLMSIAGLLAIMAAPALPRGSYKSLLEFLLATGVGTLCGDALLHLLPHVLVHGSEGESKYQPILRGTFALLSIFFFFVIELFLKFSVQNQKMLRGSTSDELGKMITIQGESANKFDHHGHQHLDGSNENGAIASMVIIGDILHNVTDGLSIGAAFTSSISSGFAASIAIFSHELPHELGDYAALISSGMSKRKTIFYNIVSSIFSYIGMVIGILLGEIQHASLWINAFTAGSFLYISLSDLVPEMKIRISGENKVKNIMIQTSGLICGGFIMVCVALYEDDLETLLN